MTRTTRIRPRIALLLATAVLLGGAAAVAGAPAGAIPTPPSPPTARQPPVDPAIADGSAQRALDAARERWAEAEIGSYAMRARISCFCDRQTTRPRTLVVRDGRPARVRGKPVPVALRPYATVSRLFARVQAAIDDRVALLTVRYDRRGVVRGLYVDRSFSIADEERGITVDRFRRVR